MEKQLINIYNGKTEIKKIQSKKDRDYFIKGFNTSGKSCFNITKKVSYDDIIYYDIETVNLGVDYKKVLSYNPLDLRKNILKSFSLLIPKNKFFIKQMKEVKKLVGSNKLIDDKKNRGAIHLGEKNENYFTLFIANDNNSSFLLETLILCFNLFSRKSHHKKTDNKTSSTLKIIGFNNNKFDDLIFKHYKGFNLFIDNVNKVNKIQLPLVGHTLNIESHDLRNVSKHFGGYSLKQVGEQIKLPKLEITDNKNKSFKDIVITNINYNNRDNEIVYRFLKFLNEDMGIYQTNISNYARKFFYNKMFEVLKVNSIQVSKIINGFTLFGGRTEPYINLKTSNDTIIKYVDFNSLYPSSRVVLDMVKGVIKEKIDTEGKKQLIYDYKLNKVLIPGQFNYTMEKIKNFYITKIFNKSGFNYLELQELYRSIDKNFYLGKFKIKNIANEFIDFVELIENFFPFVSKIKGKSSFSFKENVEYEIGFYELMFLPLFDFEIISLYKMDKGDDELKELLSSMYSERKEMKKDGNKLEKLIKLQLNAGGYGIYATKNIESELILDNRKIETLNNFSLNYKNRDKKEIWTELKDNGIGFTDNKDIFNIKNIGDNYYIEKEKSGKKWTSNSISVKALNIVSNSRFMMYSIYLDYIFSREEEERKLKNIKIFYTDTDSLFCDVSLFERMKNNGLIGDKMGQLKDELPNHTIKKLLCFAPKTYEYIYEDEKGEQTIKRIFKGTGDDIKKEIISQSVKTDFRDNKIIRTALDPDNIQKRYLENNIFKNKFGVSEELKSEWETYEKDFKK